MANGFSYRSSAIRRMAFSLKSPSMRTIPGAITSAPLQRWGTAPMSTMILGRSGKISSKVSVGDSVSLSFASIGFPLMMKILVDWVSASSMRGLGPSSCLVSMLRFCESSWRIFSVSFSFRKCLLMVLGIVEYFYAITFKLFSFAPIEGGEGNV